jgi:hypothetical protein
VAGGAARVAGGVASLAASFAAALPADLAAAMVALGGGGHNDRALVWAVAGLLAITLDAAVVITVNRSHVTKSRKNQKIELLARIRHKKLYVNRLVTKLLRIAFVTKKHQITASESIKK